MQILNDFSENKNLSLTLGTFDGMHPGHVAVIKSTADFAKANGLKSALITFKENPCRLLEGKAVENICSREEKLSLISQIGIDFTYEIDFTMEFASMSAEEYLQNILVKYFSPRSISTGYNHKFGYKNKGDATLLKEAGSVYNYEYFEIPPQIIDGEVPSSSLIRKKLSNGLIERANRLLGRKFSISGTVTYGNRLGSKIGFKTANMKYPSGTIKIPHGVYQAEVEILGSQKAYKSVVNFGVKPSLKQDPKEPIVEAHILDGFCADIYGEEINVRFEKRIRDELFFDSFERLKEQIDKDIASVVAG